MVCRIQIKRKTAFTSKFLRAYMAETGLLAANRKLCSKRMYAYIYDVLITVTDVLFFVFSFFTFLSLCSLSTVTNSYPLLLFSVLLLLFPDLSFHRILVLPRLLFCPLTGQLNSLPVFHLRFHSHDHPVYTLSSPVPS